MRDGERDGVRMEETVRAVLSSSAHFRGHCAHIYIHTHIHTYIHTYKYTYKHTKEHTVSVPKVETAAARTTAFSRMTLLKMNLMYREGVSVDTPTVPDVT